MKKNEVKTLLSSYRDAMRNKMVDCDELTSITITVTNTSLDITGDISLPKVPPDQAFALTGAFRLTTITVMAVLKEFIDDNERIVINLFVRNGQIQVRSSVDDEEDDKKLRRILMDNDLSMLYKHEDKVFVLECLQSKYNATHSSGIQWAIEHINNNQ